MTGLGTLPGYTSSGASAINDKGQIAGGVSSNNGVSGNGWFLSYGEAFLYSDGVMTGLGVLNGDVTSGASAINNNGQLVGVSMDATLGSRPFLYTGKRMYDLNTLTVNSPEALTSASGINDSGQIAANNSTGAYLLSPVQGYFVPVAPCRLIDARTSGAPFSGKRDFTISQIGCVPSGMPAYALNITAIPHGPLGYLTVWPSGLAQPNVSTLNSWDGSPVANAAIVASGQNGAISVFASGSTDLIIDVNGYFNPGIGDAFYPVTPCRVADTRGPAGPFGGPALASDETRDFTMLSSPCGLPSTATAYSLNVTAVPEGYLGFLTSWATGQPQPAVSTLNSWSGKTVANAAITAAGVNGATSVYVTNPTDVILDVNGYFAPQGQPGALTYYAVAPCRIADTREEDGPFGGPILEAQTTRTFAVPQSDCAIPASAAAYSLNITVVPDGPLSFLTAWPAGSPQPPVSTLNSTDGMVVANAAIVAAGTEGAISVYVASRTHVILDINCYFAP